MSATAAAPAATLDVPGEASASTESGFDSAMRALLRMDPIGSLLLVRGRLHHLIIALASVLLFALVLIVLPYRWAPLPDPKTFFFSLDGFITIVSWFVFVPVVWGFYAWQPAAIVRLRERLRATVRAGTDGSRGMSDDIDAAAASVDRWLHSPIWTGVAVGLAAFEFNRFMTPPHRFTSGGPWIYASPIWLQAFFTLLASLTYYMMALLVIRQIIATIGISRVFERDVVPVRFLHADECGGLRFLGEHALGIVPLIVATGLNASLSYLRIITGRPMGETALYSLIAVTVIYIVGFVACFIAPLWSAHRRMLQARDAWLDDIARGFELQQVRVAEQMRHGQPDAATVAGLETARKAWDIGRSLPTWPLNVGSARKFTAALFSPLLPIGIALLQQLLLS